MAIGSGENAGSLVARNYASIRGVDFTNRKDEVAIVRSPDMLNMWKNYKSSNGLCVETRPDLVKYKEYDDKVYGIFFYTYNGKKHQITYTGSKIYDDDKVILEDLDQEKVSFFVYQTKLYIIDTKEYYVYDGEEIKPVVGYIPMTTISRAPSGGGTVYQDVNLLSSYRKNSFCSDGESAEYHLDVESYDSDYKVKIWINDELVDNSVKENVHDGNGYIKYTKGDDVYWYDTDNSQLYTSDYDKIVDGELHNDNGYIKYTKDGKYYWYDSSVKCLYDEDGVMVSTDLTGYTKVTISITLSDLTICTDYPYTEDPSTGIITFFSPPEEPLTDGSDNVIIQFRRTVTGYRDRIANCTIIEQFDNRVFFAGNPNYPNVLWHCSLDDPTYCSDNDYYEEGVSDSAIKGIVAGNNALWVLKEPSQTNTTIFYHNPTIDSDYGKTYPSSHSSISTGCIGGSENFNDKIVFFSNRGMEGISSDVTTEQVISHLSSFVDNRLLQEENYKNMILQEYEGYLLVFIDNHVYLADSRATGTVNSHTEYEWFYWELPVNVDSTVVDDGILYIISDNIIYTLTNDNEDREVEAYITTFDDEFSYPQMRKITNKRGCTIDVEGQTISLYVKTDKTDFEKIKDYEVNKGRIVPKIKRKKWKSIQLKLVSQKPFYFYSATLESYITNYLKK